MDVSKDQICEGLRALGLGRQSVVVVHSSLSSFGRVDGGAQAVADALVSTCGTVVVPSGTWDHTGVSFPPGLERPNNATRPATTWSEFDSALDRAVPYSPDLPIDKELGAVPEAMRVGYEHVRGSNPLFSFLARGPAAEEAIGSVRLGWPLGPLEVAERLDAAVLLLGVDHTRNTTIHLAEQRLGRSHFYRCAKIAAGVWAEFPNVPGQSHRFDDLEPALRPLTREVSIGGCLARAVGVRDVLREATQAILADPGALLCADGSCSKADGRCGAARCQREAVLASGRRGGSR